MSERYDPFRHAERLAAKTRRLGAAFLLCELHNGLALLDTIAVSADRDADRRRHALALEAHDVVAERLARTGERAVVLTDEERDEITRLRDELDLRLDHFRLERDTKR